MCFVWLLATWLLSHHTRHCYLHAPIATQNNLPHANMSLDIISRHHWHRYFPEQTTPPKEQILCYKKALSDRQLTREGILPLWSPSTATTSSNLWYYLCLLIWFFLLCTSLTKRPAPPTQRKNHLIARLNQYANVPSVTWIQLLPSTIPWCSIISAIASLSALTLWQYLYAPLVSIVPQLSLLVGGFVFLLWLGRLITWLSLHT